MDAITTFEIIFADPTRTYMEGEEVKGEVVIELIADLVIESNYKLFVLLQYLNRL